MSDDKKRTMTFEISKELHDDLKDFAKTQEQSMSGVLRSLIMEAVRSNDPVVNQ